MGDNDPRSLPIFPSVIFIVAPILGITGLLCWATIQNRRGFGVRITNERREVKLLSEEDRPGLYEVWVENNLKAPYEDLEGRDQPMYLHSTHGELGDPRFLCMLIPRPLALKPASPEVIPSGENAAEYNILATLVRMPQHAKPTGKTITGGPVVDPGAEVLIGTSPVRVTDAGDSSDPKTRESMDWHKP